MKPKYKQPPLTVSHGPGTGVQKYLDRLDSWRLEHNRQIEDLGKKRKAYTKPNFAER